MVYNALSKNNNRFRKWTEKFVCKKSGSSIPKERYETEQHILNKMNDRGHNDNDKTIKLGCRNKRENGNSDTTKWNKPNHKQNNTRNSNHIIVIIMAKWTANANGSWLQYTIFKTKYIEFENSAHTQRKRRSTKNWLRNKNCIMIYSNEWMNEAKIKPNEIKWSRTETECEVRQRWSHARARNNYPQLQIQRSIKRKTWIRNCNITKFSN